MTIVSDYFKKFYSPPPMEEDQKKRLEEYRKTNEGIISRMFSKPTEVKPVVKDGKIESITISSPGSGYTTSPVVDLPTDSSGRIQRATQSSQPAQQQTAFGTTVKRVHVTPPLKRNTWKFHDGRWYTDMNSYLGNLTAGIRCPICRIHVDKESFEKFNPDIGYEHEHMCGTKLVLVETVD